MMATFRVDLDTGSHSPIPSVSIGSTCIRNSRARVGVVLKAPVAAINAHRIILVILVTWLVLLVAFRHTKTPCRKIGWIMDWRIHKIWAGSRPHLLSMARLQAHIVLMDFSVLISICLDQVSFWSMWTSKYFTYLFNWIGLSKMERPIV